MKHYLPEDFPNRGDFVPEKYKTVVYFDLIYCIGKERKFVRTCRFDFGEFFEEWQVKKLLPFELKAQDKHYWYRNLKYYVVDREDK